MTVDEAVSHVVKQVRLNRKVTRPTLGKRIRLETQTVWEIETFRAWVKLGTFVNIAFALDLTAEELLQRVLDQMHERE